jgi:hypothetical protein
MLDDAHSERQNKRMMLVRLMGSWGFIVVMWFRWELWELCQYMMKCEFMKFVYMRHRELHELHGQIQRQRVKQRV